MTIKKRMVISFSLMIAIIIFIAVILFFQGRTQRYYLEQSIESYSMMVGIREIQYYLEKSANAFDFYLVLGEATEKNRFCEFSKMLKQKIDSYSEHLLTKNKNFDIQDNSENDNFADITNLGNILISRWNDTIIVYDSGVKKKAIASTDKNIVPLFTKTKAKISELYNSKKEIFNLAEKHSVSLERINLILSAGLSIAAVFLALMLSVSLFRSISQPLSKLKEGAEKIGAGNFGYEINLSASTDELTSLAESFNKMARNLKRSETQIMQMDRMTSLGQLAGGIAHELNNPLTGVLGQSKILLEKLPADDPSRETIEKITNSAERCRKITKGLLDFSRQKDYHFELTDIHKIVDTSLEICFSDIVASKIRVVKNYEKNIPKIQISISHIQQVFLNIIINAIHSMKNGGMLTVKTEVGSWKLEVGTNSQFTDFVEVVFRDTGEGISKENIKKMFTPFFTTKDPGKGTGLGLAISYGIIQRHSGEILVSSDGEGKGATFAVRLPS